MPAHDHISVSSPWPPLAVTLGALAVAAVAVTDALPALEFAFVITAALVLGIAHRAALSWGTQLTGIVLVILFIPIRRYVIPGDLPIDLEPYRALMALMVVMWGVALLIDPAVRLCRSGFEVPIAAIVVAVMASVALNPARVSAASDDVVKDLSFLLSFLLLFYLIISVVRGRRQIDRILSVLVVGGSVVALFALVEARTRWNVFNEMSSVLPFLDVVEIPEERSRGGALRTFGPAQHPIALGAAMVTLLPLAIYLARTRASRWWWLCVAAVSLGVFASVSRTSVVMLAVAAVMFLILRPRATRRILLPALVLVPLLVHVALPGTLGALKTSFFPEGGLVADQQRSAGSAGSGRLADLGPAFEEAAKTPLFGQAYGSRVVGGESPGENAQILDNQWLKLLLETGVLGLVAWLWFLVAIIRRLSRAAKEDPDPSGWLFVALASSVTAFAVGMLTLDSFSFIQATFIFWIVLALGARALLDRASAAPAPVAPGLRRLNPAVE